MRVAHLSDFHLGVPSRGARAVERAVAWVAERRARPRLRDRRPALAARRASACSRLVARLEHPTSCSGTTTSPLARSVLASRRARPTLAPATLLSTPRARSRCAAAGRVAGVDPRTWYRRARSRPLAGVRCGPADPALPRPGDRRHARAGPFGPVLAGHLHAGQIVMPYGRGRLLLAHPRARVPDGRLRAAGRTVLHVSPGLGTTFVPFRLLRPAGGDGARPTIVRHGEAKRDLARTSSPATPPTRRSRWRACDGWSGATCRSRRR